MPDSFVHPKFPNRNRAGRFVKITNVPEKKSRSSPKGTSGYVIINTHGLKAGTADLKRLNAKVAQAILDDPDKRAAQIQARLRLAASLAYNKSATGRVARGIYAKVQKVGTADGKGIQTAITVSVLNYRETRFITNLGGEGYFKHFPVQPYRIFAKGAEGLDSLSNPATGITSRTSTKKAIGLALSKEGVGRLKVPRGSAFFTSSRQQGRGGGETRTINNVLGPADFAARQGPFIHPGDRTIDKKGEFFFYPLWVNHPGFPQDVISEVALQEGSTFTTEVADKVLQAWSELRAERVPGAARMPESDVVVSGIIPLPGTEVRLAAESTFIGYSRRTIARNQELNYTVDSTGRRIR